MPKADSGFPSSKSCFPELACSLDQRDVELGGRETAERVRRVLLSSHLPGSTFCGETPAEVTARSGGVPCHQQGPGGGGRGCMVPSICHDPAQTGISSVGRMLSAAVYSKPASQAVHVNHSRVETDPAPACYPACTSHHFSTSHLRQHEKLKIIHFPWY